MLQMIFLPKNSIGITLSHVKATCAAGDQPAGIDRKAALEGLTCAVCAQWLFQQRLCWAHILCCGAFGEGGFIWSAGVVWEGQAGSRGSAAHPLRCPEWTGSPASHRQGPSHGNQDISSGQHRPKNLDDHMRENPACQCACSEAVARSGLCKQACLLRVSDYLCH